MAAFIVPPVAIRSSTNTTLSPFLIDDISISISAEPYSRSYDSDTVSHGSFPFFLTGTNGREKTTSTGMGLYIAKNLCKKLGHKIEIESKENEYTRVFITFAKNKFYDVLK